MDAEPDANSAAILFNKFRARFFQAAAYYVERGAPGLMMAGLQLTNRHDAHFRFVRELLLTPIQQCSGSSALGRGNHAHQVP
jgi:hypothetical protein